MTRVLVIDDHPIVLQGCRQLLEDAGVDDIVQAQTLADGFRLYRVQRPDEAVGFIVEGDFDHFFSAVRTVPCSNSKRHSFLVD